MSNEIRHLGVLAAALRVNTKCGVLGAAGDCEEFDPVLVHRERLH